jgi:hypothetical protein
MRETVEGQAAYEAAWLGRWWQLQYWIKIDAQLHTSGSQDVSQLQGAKDILAASSNPASDDGGKLGAETTANTADT